MARSIMTLKSIIRAEDLLGSNLRQFPMGEYMALVAFTYKSNYPFRNLPLQLKTIPRYLYNSLLLYLMIQT